MFKKLLLALAVTTCFFSCKKDDDNETAHTPGSYAADMTYQRYGEEVNLMAAQPDGKVIVAGSGKIARLNADGSLDASFNAPSNYQQPDWAYLAMMLQPDGNILLGLKKQTGQTGPGLIRLLPTGELDPGFSVSNIASANTEPQPWVSSIALLPGGSIAVGGNIRYSNFYHWLPLYANGAVMTTYVNAIGFAIPTWTVSALQKLSDGSMLISGEMSGTISQQPFVGFVKINENLSINSGFLVTQKLFSGSGAQAKAVGASQIIEQPDGKLLIRGDFESVGESPATAVARPGVARFNADGTLDDTFVPAFGGHIALLPNGNIIVGAITANPAGEANFCAVLDNSGKQVVAFGNAGITSGSVKCIVPISATEVLFGGTFMVGTERRGIIRLRVR